MLENMPQTGALMSMNDYLSTSFRPDREYVDGVIVERNLGEKDHSTLQMAISAALFNRRQEWGIHVFPEQRVQVKARRFRVPDVCVVVGQEPQEQIFTQAPFLCIEILSKDDRMSEMQERIDDYLAFGVAYIWLVDPRTKRAWVCTAAGMQEVTDGVLRTANPGIEVSLGEIFGRV
jgi:Uma2 family endonuclease